MNNYDDEIRIEIDMSELEKIKEAKSIQESVKEIRLDNIIIRNDDFESFEEWENLINQEIFKDIQKFNDSLNEEEEKELRLYLKVEALENKVKVEIKDEEIEFDASDFVSLEAQYEELVNQLTTINDVKQNNNILNKVIHIDVPEEVKVFSSRGLEYFSDDYEKLVNDLDKPNVKYDVKPNKSIKPIVKNSKLNEVKNIQTELNDNLRDRKVVFHPHGEVRWNERFETTFDHQIVKDEIFKAIIDDAQIQTIGEWREFYFKTREMFNYKIVYKPLHKIIVIKTLYRRDKASKEVYRQDQK